MKKKVILQFITILGSCFIPLPVVCIIYSLITLHLPPLDMVISMSATSLIIGLVCAITFIKLNK